MLGEGSRGSSAWASPLPQHWGKGRGWGPARAQASALQSKSSAHTCIPWSAPTSRSRHIPKMMQNGARAGSPDAASAERYGGDDDRSGRLAAHAREPHVVRVAGRIGDDIHLGGAKAGGRGHEPDRDG